MIRTTSMIAVTAAIVVAAACVSAESRRSAADSSAAANPGVAVRSDAIDSSAGSHQAPNAAPFPGVVSGPPDRTLAGVSQGMSATDIRRLLGQPADIGEMRFDQMLGDSAQTWRYPAVEIELVGGKAETLACTSPACMSGRGVRVGDREQDVIARYGSVDRTRDEEGESLAYTDATDGCGITFSLAAGRVRGIRVWCDNS